MPNKKDDQSKNLIAHDPDLEEKVTKMLDPSLPDEPEQVQVVPDIDPTTAPEFNPADLPTEIKFIDQTPAPVEVGEEPKTAPELNDQAVQADQVQQTEEPAPESSGQVINPEPTLADSAEQTTDTELPPIKDDAETIKAVEDIVATDSDAILAAEDEKVAAAFVSQPKPTSGQKIRNFIKSWWKNPKSRYGTIGLFLIAFLGIGIVPQSRYYVLNSVGVRGSTSVRVIDQSTLQPLKNVTVSVGDAIVKTDNNGNATLQKLRLGPTELNIEKRAFAAETKRLTIGWGSNPQGETSLKPTGTQYAFVLGDFLSGKPVEKAEAESGESSAFSDAEGKLLLTMDQPSDEFEVKIRSDGHREETITVNADSKTEESVKLVANRPHIFVSKRSGKFDIYKIDVDGKNEHLVLEGTGYEKPDMSLVPHENRNLVAVVSTRDGTRNADGFLLSTLTIIDLDEDDTKEVSSSERIHVIGWHGNRVVFVKIAEGASAISPKRHRLMSYDFSSGNEVEIASSNYFNDVMMVNGYIYYAPSAMQQEGVNVSLFKVNPDGTNNDVVFDKEVWNLFRTSYDKLSISSPGEWNEYGLNDGKLAQLSGEPANLVNRIYIDSPYSGLSLWIEIRDGKGVLLVHDKQSGDDKVLNTQSGLSNPLFWLNKNTVVYRIVTDGETADYALNIDGGDPKKIVDVTNTSGIDSWYYY